MYTIFLVITDEVSDEERDDFLRIFSHHDCQTAEAAWWWQEWRAEDPAMQDVKKMEGYEEMVRKFASGLTLEQRFAGLSPEQVLGAFSPEQRLLSMPDDVLRALSEEFVRSLPADVQDAIRKRIGGPSK